MKQVSIAGIGAVSPAGWSIDSMRDALAKGDVLPARDLPRPGSAPPYRVHRVPPLTQRQEFQTHPRLRRTSPIAQYAVSASLEALDNDAQHVRDGSIRLGVVLCVMAGCVNYSRRFYGETLHDPASASPVVFPETVFNAPASHLASLLGSTEINYTLVGDPGMFLVGLALGAQWLVQDRVDACLIVGAEEIDWIVADASRRFARGSVLSEGAGAIYLRVSPTDPAAVQLTGVTDSHPFLQHLDPTAAACAMRAQLPAGAADHLLCDGLQGVPKLDCPELTAWADWPGARVSLKRILGEGLAAGSAWQCVAAVDALRQRRHTAALVSVVGCNQQAVGAHLTAAPPPEGGNNPGLDSSSASWHDVPRT